MKIFLLILSFTIIGCTFTRTITSEQNCIQYGFDPETKEFDKCVSDEIARLEVRHQDLMYHLFISSH